MVDDAVVFVTGGAGYIGSHVVLELVEARFHVVVLDNLSTGMQHAIPSGVDLLVGDIGSADFVREALTTWHPATVMHFAGSISVPESVRIPMKYYRNNVAASANLIEQCIDCGVRAFIFSSTAAVYGIPPDILVDEDTPLAPINPYGSSKLMVEWMLRDVAATDAMRYVCLRYFNVAGADRQLRAGQHTTGSGHLISTACNAALTGSYRMQIFGSDYETPDGTCVRDFIHVSDLSSAHVRALRYLLDGGQSTILNCGYGKGHSVREVIAAVEQAAGHRFEIVLTDRRPGDPPALIAATDRIRNTLAWQPANEDLDVIVESALAWSRHLRKASI